MASELIPFPPLGADEHASAETERSHRNAWAPAAWRDYFAGSNFGVGDCRGSHRRSGPLYIGRLLPRRRLSRSHAVLP
jgi:hypothetical protein